MTETSPKANAVDLVTKYADIIKGKTILVTGVSPGGLGAFFLETIIKANPGLLILAGRNRSKGEEEAKKLSEINPDVELRLLDLDLASYASVRKAAEVVNAGPNIDVLVNNAALMAGPYRKTEDGNENQFQSNHLSHFLFTNLIIEKVLAVNGRVVNVSSDGCRYGRVRYYDYNFHDGESYHQWIAYGQSKTAQILFSAELARRLGKRGLLSLSIHPGSIWTNLGQSIKDDHEASLEALHAMDRQLGNEVGWRDFRFDSPMEAIATHVYASFDPDVKEHNGAFLRYCKPCPPEDMHVWTLGELEARKCWDLSEKLVGQKFEY
ncbi:short-chain dehydrogenase/ reductase [Naematelia encephala]|uniref:Short-chain dehydrogenase/ reductase n=1 Tax=Naematelia encephala TaxID=71784 RepID=A0A1Y2ALT3_9TREE|nr:short-chain dehydrogenase/ reductase [Naematelia encephala]